MTGASGRISAKLGIALATLAGALGAVYLVFYVGFEAVWAALLSVGWGGFALLCLYGAANFVLLGLAWLLLVPPWGWRRAGTFCWGRAVRDSAGDVLPFSQLGGLVIGARAVILRGVARSAAFASTIVDATLEMIAQVAFVVCGIALVAIYVPGVASDAPMVRMTIVAILVAMLAAGAFFLLQRRGFALFERAAERLLPAAAVRAAAVGRAIGAIHGEPRRMAASFAVHLLGWLASAFGTWLALQLVGAPIEFGAAVAIESLLCAARSVAVFMPGAIGIQEAGYAAMMPLFGLPIELGIAISFLKRGREIALAVPVLLSWQISEASRAAGGKSATALAD